MMHKNGFNTTVASMGTSLTANHLEKVWAYSDEPIICMDGDIAGRESMTRTAILAMKYLRPGKSLRFCYLPENEDPDSFLRCNSREEMSKLLAKSVQLVDFIWDYFVGELDKIKQKTPEKISEWKKNIFLHIDSIDDLDIKMLYRTEIISRINTILKTKTNDSVFFKKLSKMNFNIDMKEKILLREAILLYILTMRQSIIFFVIEELSGIEFSNDSFRRLKDCIIKASDGKGLNVEKCQDEIAYVTSVAAKHCDLVNMDDGAILELWKNVFEFGYSKKLHTKDLISAKQECSNALSDSTWTRLKALKIEQLSRNKNP
jgi:DNA primase